MSLKANRQLFGTPFVYYMPNTVQKRKYGSMEILRYGRK